jgi:hypothetical protein
MKKKGTTLIHRPTGDSKNLIMCLMISEAAYLTLNRVSDNVGPCQALLSALLHALKEERHFALIDGVAFPNRRLARNRFPGQELSPTHASLRSQPRS